MKRVLPLFCCLFIHAFAFAQKDCRHSEYEEKMLSDHPEMIKKQDAIEEFIKNQTTGRRTVMSGSTGTFSLPEVITIPVVVHILYNSDAQNISDKQVNSQLEVLNKDYRNLNSDKTNVPSYFSNLVADCGFQFKLAKTDPKGAPTSGIVRRKTSILNFGTDDRAKYTAQGGDDAWDASKYLNIWVCNLSGGLIGYSSLVGCSADIDGVVILTTAFGISNSNNSSFNKGRTATHEIGHWLNLRHIWGDSYCGDDKVDDTPTQRSPNRGCPSGENFTCGTTAHGDLYMNFMDLTNDECMYMFTNGQRDRMRASFMPGGPRNSILTSDVLTSTQPESAPLPGTDGQLAAMNLQVYPNPATTSITVQIEETKVVAGRTFVIYNHTGQPVQNFIANSEKTAVDISHLPNGMYYIKAKDGGTGLMTKFVKVR